MPGRIYLDHVASTPLSPGARRALSEALSIAGNPSSPHAEGRAARECLEDARERVASALGCRAREIVFTASGTVACQIALCGAARARAGTSRRVVLSAVEHPAVAEAGDLLADAGFEIVSVPCEKDGTMSASRFLDTVGEDAAAAALMLANHETGTCMPIPEVAGVLRTRRIPFVCDATLAPGRIPCRVADLGADLIAWSGHKCGGPRGVGALHVRSRTRLEPLWGGGLDEDRLHPGVPAVAAAAGLAAAIAEAVDATGERAARYEALLGTFLGAVDPTLGCRLVGREGVGLRDVEAGARRLPGVATLELPGVEGEAAMINLDLEGIAVGTGSSCALGGTDPSPTLLAMGFTRRRAAATVRISIGEGVSEDDVTTAAHTLNRVVVRLRSLAGRGRRA